jgi:AcrR family transcriptional regulator
MSRRREAVAATRRRIVEATMELHGEQGIAATTLQDVAERADVAIGTVYRHFPTVEDVVTACGTAAMELMAMPSPAEVAGRFDGARSSAERIERLAADVAALYRDWALLFRRGREAKDQFEFVGRQHRESERALDALVDEALRGSRPSRAQRATVRALVDDRFWESMIEQGLDAARAERELARLIAAAVQKG